MFPAAYTSTSTTLGVTGLKSEVNVRLSGVEALVVTQIVVQCHSTANHF